MKTKDTSVSKLFLMMGILVLLSSSVYSQADTLVIYNGDDISPDWFTIAVDEINNNASNPQLGEANPGQTVISIFRNADGEPWEGGGVGGLDIDISTYTKFTVMVFKSDTGNVQIELQRDAGNLYLQDFYDTPGAWKTMEYTVPDSIDTPEDTIVHTLLVAPHSHETAGTAFQGQNMYWDNVFAISSGVETSNELEENSPQRFRLNQNYPNPFNPSTIISFSLPVSSNVKLEVYDLMGRKVRSLLNGQMSTGEHEVAFNASGLSSGIYIYRLQAGDNVINKMMTLLK